MAELKRSLGLLGATDVGVGAIIGAGIFVLSGVAAGLAGPSVILSQGDLSTLAAVFNFGTLLTFLFINLSMLQLRRTMPEAKRSFVVPLYPLPPVLGILTCIGLMAFLHLEALAIAVIWITIGFLIYSRSRRFMDVSAKKK